MKVYDFDNAGYQLAVYCLQALHKRYQEDYEFRLLVDMALVASLKEVNG